MKKAHAVMVCQSMLCSSFYFLKTVDVVHGYRRLNTHVCGFLVSRRLMKLKKVGAMSTIMPMRIMCMLDT